MANWIISNVVDFK